MDLEEIIDQGSDRNTLSLEFQLFLNLEKPKPSTLNIHLFSVSHSRYTRWNWQDSNWSNNYVLANASYDGCMEIVNMMLLQGGKAELPSKVFSTENYNDAMAQASKNDHRDIVKLMLDLGATDYNWAMMTASCYGHLEIVKMMVELGSTDYNRALYYAHLYKQTHIVEYLTSLMSR